MNNGSTVGTLLCAGVIAIPIAISFGLALLYGGIELFNSIANQMESDAYVERPAISKATVIVVLTAITQFGLHNFFNLIFGAPTVAQLQQGAWKSAVLISIFLVYPVDMLVMAGTMSWLLSITFRRAVLVTIYCFLICILLFLVVGVIGLGFLYMYMYKGF